MKKLSLVIPCYNEEKNLPLLLNRCKHIVTRNDVEIILVDNGSTDKTPHVLKELLPQFPFARSVRVDINQGYGHGILTGLRSASGTILAWTHADMQTDPGDAIKGLEIFENTPDNKLLFVKGQRYGRPVADVFFTIGMAVFETLLLRKSMWDINAQPTMFPRTFFESWKNPPDDFSLDLFAYYTAKLSGYKILRFPVRFGERAHGLSHWNISIAAKYKFIKRTFSYSIALYNRMK